MKMEIPESMLAFGEEKESLLDIHKTIFETLRNLNQELDNRYGKKVWLPLSQIRKIILQMTDYSEYRAYSIVRGWIIKRKVKAFKKRNRVYVRFID